MKVTPGERTVIFAIIALAFLLVGLSLCLSFPKAGEAIFTPYSVGVVGVVAMVATKHGVESLATGNGIAGSWRSLVTEQKPPEPKPLEAP